MTIRKDTQLTAKHLQMIPKSVKKSLKVKVATRRKRKMIMDMNIKKKEEERVEEIRELLEMKKNLMNLILMITKKMVRSGHIKQFIFCF